MGIFSRDKDTSSQDDRSDQIGEFWTWWQETGSQETSRLVGTDEAGSLEEVLSPRVGAIDEDLSWDLVSGSESLHRLVVTANGDPEQRAVARRWLNAAPPTDLVWSYADSRPAATDVMETTAEIEGHELALGEVLVGVRRTGSRLDVAVHHPQLADLSDEGQTAAAFLALDQALGEEGTESWIGELTTSEVKPLDGFGLRGLIAVVRDLKAEFTRSDGSPEWLTLEGQGPRGAVAASSQVPLSAASAPELDVYVLVTLPFGQRTESGLPAPESAASLDAFEKQLNGALESKGQVVAHDSAGGVRRLHVYVDGTTSGAELVQAAAKMWREGSAKTAVEYDPGWSAVQHLRG